VDIRLEIFSAAVVINGQLCGDVGCTRMAAAWSQTPATHVNPINGDQNCLL
jgi:hypothetical protein